MATCDQAAFLKPNSKCFNFHEIWHSYHFLAAGNGKYPFFPKMISRAKNSFLYESSFEDETSICAQQVAILNVYQYAMYVCASLS